MHVKEPRLGITRSLGTQRSYCKMVPLRAQIQSITLLINLVTEGAEHPFLGIRDARLKETRSRGNRSAGSNMFSQPAEHVSGFHIAD